MQEDSYAALHQLENTHWWFVGARFIYQTLIKIGLGEEAKNPRMLEVGCGSGGNLPTLSAFGPTVGLEVSSQALTMIKDRPQLGLVQANAEALPFASDSFDGVHLWAVLEHLEDDLVGLREAWRVCRPHGSVTLQTAALPVLWSHHDEANLHKRRYVRDQLADLLRTAQLSPIHLSYQNFFAFFPTLVIRRVQRFFVRSPRYDMGTSNPWITKIMLKVLRFEAWFLKKYKFPIGVDLVAVCRVHK
jgi:ubiquinone/menaquinone biosynthesis C-methylase UbiE